MRRIRLSLHCETGEIKNHGRTERHCSGEEINPRGYVERFTRVGVEVNGVQDSLKCFVFVNNFCDDCKFKEGLGFKAAKDMSDLLTRVQPYINY